MYRVAIIGDRDSILGFKAVGMSVFPVASSTEAEEILSEIARQNFAVIYITEQIARDMTESISKYNDKKIPAIIPVPWNQGTLGIGMQGVRKCVERAVGADILFMDK